MKTTELEFEIKLGLPESHRHRAAEILYLAFERKFQPVFKSAAQAVPILAQGLVPEMTVVALAGQEVGGVMGFYYHKQNFCQPNLASFVAQFGRLNGLFRLMMFRLFILGGGHDLVVEAIAVDELWRGHGVGTRLLTAAFDFARQHGFASVSLEVVDTNPGAQRLYERVGFVATKTRAYPYLRNLMGFSAATTMVKKIV